MNALDIFIRNEIQQKGPIPFETFMDWALYHQEGGYYATAHAIGKDGDFYTSPYISEVFGKCIASFFSNYFTQHNIKTPTLMELGSGKGLLLKDVIQNMNSCIKIDTLHIIEKNPSIVKIDSLEIDSIYLHPSLWELDLKPFTGAIWCNEFFDALPAARLKVSHGKTNKSFINIQGNILNELWLEAPLSHDEQEFMGLYKKYIPDNYIVEVPVKLKKILQEIKSFIEDGVLLVIDYGNTANVLYSSQPPNGTIRSFHKHIVDADVLTEPGTRDITYDINFDYLKYCAERAGFKQLFYKTQGEFLVDNGILDAFSQNLDLKSLKNNLALKNLMLPGGMGEIFKVAVFSA